MAEAGNTETSSEGRKKEAVKRDDIAVSTMSNALEKLRILNYEKDFKKNFTLFNELQFAYPSSNTSNQFKLFLDLICYLMKKCNQEFVVDKYDDPNTSVNKLILSLKSMDVNLDFPAAKLKQGFGDAVCAAIDYLCDKALETRNFAWTKPSYPKEEFAEQAEVDDDAQVDLTEDDAGEVEEEEMYSETVNNPSAGNTLEESQREMITSDVDPLLWKAEVERVGSRLRLRAKDDTGREWHGHIEKARKHETLIQELLPHAFAQLKHIHGVLVETLERMNAKENMINNQFEPLRGEYHQLKDRLVLITDRCQEESDKVDAMAKQYSEVTDQLQEAKDIMEERGSKMTDTTPLVQIKEILKTLQSEIKDFELRIGVVGNTLLRARNRKQNQCLSSKHTWNQETYNPVEYDLSDDDDSN